MEEDGGRIEEHFFRSDKKYNKLNIHMIQWTTHHAHFFQLNLKLLKHVSSAAVVIENFHNIYTPGNSMLTKCSFILILLSEFIKIFKHLRLCLATAIHNLKCWKLAGKVLLLAQCLHGLRHCLDNIPAWNYNLGFVRYCSLLKFQICQHTN